MTISSKDWVRYINRLAAVNKKAAEDMQSYIQKHGFGDTQEIIDFAYALATKYGEAAASAACEMYDAVAETQGMTLPTADPAPTATYPEVAKAVNGTLKQSPEQMYRAMSRLVKQAGADTMLQNAGRDGAEFAWIPHGDTCAFCMTLASRGWQRISKKALKNGHAEHIHSNCDCEYAIRFDGKSSVEGYDPERYRRIYDNMPGSTPEEKIKSLRNLLNGPTPLTLDQVDFIIDLEHDASFLGQKTPSEWKKHLEFLGFELSPLNRGSLKGLQFENGGGFRFHYRGDGYFQYHPKGTHHGDAYYKTSTAKNGIKRYNLDGSDKND